MRLKDILPDNPVQIMARTNYPESVLPYVNEESAEQGLFVGYCHWDGEQLISDDGDYYSIDEVVSKYKYEADGSLVYWRASRWSGDICMTKEQKCIAELYTLLERIEDGARHHDLTLLRTPRGASGCDMYQGLPPICRIKDDIRQRYEQIIDAALNAGGN